MSAFGRSGQFQSGKFNEYEWLLSAKSRRLQRQETETRRPPLLKVTLKVELVPLMPFIVVAVVIVMMLVLPFLAFAADSFYGIRSNKAWTAKSLAG